MQNWVWRQIVVPGIMGFFFAIGQFIVYSLTKTQPMLALEKWISVSDKTDEGKQTKADSVA